jgi:hypothetical protein
MMQGINFVSNSIKKRMFLLGVEGAPWLWSSGVNDVRS